jgi:hypothetical protein
MMLHSEPAISAQRWLDRYDVEFQPGRNSWCGLRKTRADNRADAKGLAKQLPEGDAVAHNEYYDVGWRKKDRILD